MRYTTILDHYFRSTPNGVPGTSYEQWNWTLQKWLPSEKRIMYFLAKKGEMVHVNPVHQPQPRKVLIA